MGITAVLFDIGGVLEICPEPAVGQDWEKRLGLAEGELADRMRDVWRGGSIGTITLDDVHRETQARLGLTDAQLAEFMADIWREYLGVANTELIQFAAALRPEYRTGIISNSFVGAREREQAAYGFEDLVDTIVYSHEAGLCKPDPRIYQLACDRLGVDPAQAVFVDDWDQAVAGARDVGMHAIQIVTTSQVIADLTALLHQAPERCGPSPSRQGS
jgi:epoxide hydrolase-like predicted phosphatase